jgi:hypothetical protein
MTNQNLGKFFRIVEKRGQKLHSGKIKHDDRGFDQDTIVSVISPPRISTPYMLTPQFDPQIGPVGFSVCLRAGEVAALASTGQGLMSSARAV